MPRRPAASTSAAAPLGFGALLRAVRERRGLGQAAVRDAIGVSPGAYSRWENGEAGPGPEQLRALCLTLAVSADVLLELRSPAPGELDGIPPLWPEGQVEPPQPAEAPRRGRPRKNRDEENA